MSKVINKIFGRKQVIDLEPENQIGNSQGGSEFNDDSFEKAGAEVLKAHPLLSYQQDKYRRNAERYMDVYSNIAFSTAQWRVMAFACFVVLIVSVLGNIYLSTTTKVQPYVVQVDEHGYTIPITPADESSTIDYRIIASQIGQFIFNMRTRVMDRAAQVYFARTSYKSVGDQSNAQSNLNAYYRDNVPTSATAPVDVEVRSIIPITEDSYHAEWIETIGGSGIDKDLKRSYTGVFQIVISPPNDVANLVNNPLGVYITDFNVHEKLN